MNILSRLILGLCLVAPALLAAAQQPAAPVALSIEAQPMEKALQIFAKQSGLQVIFPTELARDLSAPGIHGSFTPREALKRLLSGAPLSYTFVNDKTVAIRPSQGAAAQTPDVQPGGMRLVQSVTPAATPESASAPPATNEPGQGTVQEIIVTAQRRSERLQDVPISMSVLKGEELDKFTGRGVMEAISRVPGVAIAEVFQGGSTAITIRGVAPLTVTANTVGYYLDSVPFGFVQKALAPDASGYDLERVEVLRGPQGTLYGVTAQAGVVRVLTQDAKLDATEFKLRTELSSTQHGAENYRADGAFNLPIVEGKAAARIVLGYQNSSGWIDRPNKKGANDEERKSLRLKIDAQPTDALAVGLSTWLSRTDFGAPSIGRPDSTNLSVYDESIRDDFDSFGLKVGYTLPAFSMTSSTSYLTYDNASALDTSFNQTNILDSTFTGKVLAEEINLASTRAGAWRWNLGALYRDAEDTLYQMRHNLAGAPAGSYVQPSQYKLLSKSYAAFGEITRLVAEGKFEITAGLRYFTDDSGLRERTRLDSFTAPLVNPKFNFHKVSPRGVLTWHPSPEMTTYLSYSEGFRSGGTQAPAVQVQAPSIPPYNPDNLRNYELGAKGNVWNGRLAYDASVYYMNWQDVQQPLGVIFPSPGTGVPTQISAVVNSSAASGLGFDLGLAARPLDALTLDLTFSVNDLTQDRNVLSGNTILFRKGERLNGSPKYTIGGGADYTFPLASTGLDGKVAFSANYVSPRDARSLAGTVVTNRRGDSFLTATARIGIVSSSGWEATLFGDNLTNDDGIVAVGILPDWSTRIRPRTIGVQFDYRL